MSAPDLLLNPNNLSGIEFRVYKNRLASLCLREPHKVAILKAFITEKIEQDFCTEIYKIIFNLMAKGQDKAGNPFVVPTSFDGNTTNSTIPLGKPNYPHNKINNCALSLINTVMGELETIISTIIPDSYEALSNSRLAIGSKGKSVNI